jgi:phage terminase large subunit GpA-like protein
MRSTLHINSADALYAEQLRDILLGSVPQLSNIKPSDWAERHVIMQGKPYPGPFRDDRTPYTWEIANRFAQDDLARVITVMKGAQAGFLTGVIMNVLGWLIKNEPGNAFLTVGERYSLNNL